MRAYFAGQSEARRIVVIAVALFIVEGRQADVYGFVNRLLLERS